MWPFWMVLLASLGACTAIPKPPLSGGKVIHVGDGTEDIVLDDFQHEPRLLVSCDDRRHGDTAYFSGIVSYDLRTGALDTMVLHEYPKGLSFHPHGLDIQQLSDRLHLWVVCHDDRLKKHWISCFQISGNDLYWIRNYESPLLVSPNAVTALPDGSIYTTNDHKVRGSLSEAILAKPIAEIIHFNWLGEAQLAYRGLAYGNGITQRDGFVYAAATTGNAVYRLQMMPDGTLGEPALVAKVKGPDNLRWDGDDLLVACHLRLLKFKAHAGNPKKHSPTVVYRLKLGAEKPIPVYADRKGKVVSAGSTALLYKGRLFIGQVFGDWIVEVGQ